ncbi:MAG: hypothetical protein JOY93_06605 [Acidobacteriales bacterium]|nr:hypothetical protein [Terriglobales bacterium]
MPASKVEDGAWLHPSRLPLGAGWRGSCFAPEHEGVEPSPHELQEFCNMGYATSCHRLPRERVYDAVRFSVTRDQADLLTLCFVCEAGHRPVHHGILQYDVISNVWRDSHPDKRIQKMAECYLQSYLPRRHATAHASLGSGVQL